MSLATEYEVLRIVPGVFRFRLSDETVTVRLFAIPAQVFVKDGDIAVVVNGVLSVSSDRPRFGEYCDPERMARQKPVVPEELDVLSKPLVEIRVGEKTVVVTLEVTNFVVYPKLRDSYGSPCVTLSWVPFRIVK
ncbi:MAG: hypothetical protein ACP5HQ_07680 [Thermoprotei archaeon]